MIRRLLINQKNADKTAVIEGDKETSYGGIIDKALALQSHLKPTKNGHIAVFLQNSIDYIAAFWGVLASGMAAFPLNAFMTAHEIEPLLRLAHVRAIITSTMYRDLFEQMLLHEATSQKTKYNIIYMEDIMTGAGKRGFASIDTSIDTDSNETMLLLSTSGTTGKCKIVQLSERNVEASVLGYLNKLQIDETENSTACFLPAIPFSSAYGIMVLSACLMRSFPLVIMKPPYTLDAFYRSAEKHGVTHYEGSASIILQMERMIGRPIPYQIDALKCFGFGGSKVFGHTIERLYNAYEGKNFFQGYGMTEAAPLIAKHPNKRIIKTESVGTAIKGVDIAIAVGEDIVRTPHTKGEVVVSGPNVMRGYYENEAETERVLQNGYLYTGDIGYLDEEGYLYLCGRKKNIIIVRGFNVYPEEVEECIIGSSLARDCFVYGQTDRYGNEEVCADIVPAHDKIHSDDIRMHCAGRLAWYKRPRHISFCENIRRNEAGKVERRKGYPI